VCEATDEELVRRVCLGERDLFAQLALRHQRMIFRIVQSILDNAADSEEVLQESFLKALQHLGDFRGEARFRTWLIRIAVNEARMRRRKYRTNLHDSVDDVPEDDAGYRPRELRDWDPNPEERLARQEMARLLERAIGALPRKYREVFLLRDVEHLSSEEAAQALGINLSAAKTRLLRARLMMRDSLAPHFLRGWHRRLLHRFTQRGRYV
jgi:RNA polymerase sigma-70 factor (ECF subfamily)